MVSHSQHQKPPNYHNLGNCGAILSLPKQCLVVNSSEDSCIYSLAIDLIWTCMCLHIWIISCQYMRLTWYPSCDKPWAVQSFQRYRCNNSDLHSEQKGDLYNKADLSTKGDLYNKADLSTKGDLYNKGDISEF